MVIRNQRTCSFLGGASFAGELGLTVWVSWNLKGSIERVELRLQTHFDTHERVTDDRFDGVTLLMHRLGPDFSTATEWLTFESGEKISPIVSFVKRYFIQKANLSQTLQVQLVSMVSFLNQRDDMNTKYSWKISLSQPRLCDWALLSYCAHTHLMLGLDGSLAHFHTYRGTMTRFVIHELYVTIGMSWRRLFTCPQCWAKILCCWH